MDTHRNHPVPGEGNGSEPAPQMTVSRRALLKTGWVVPVVLSVPLMGMGNGKHKPHYGSNVKPSSGSHGSNCSSGWHHGSDDPKPGSGSGWPDHDKGSDWPKHGSDWPKQGSGSGWPKNGSDWGDKKGSGWDDKKGSGWGGKKGSDWGWGNKKDDYKGGSHSSGNGGFWKDFLFARFKWQ